jgi:apolipoprotein D and lipocalin family protein
MNSKRSLLMILLPAIMLSSMSHADQPLQLVNTVDLERYQGRWYEIARLPNRFQRQCADSVSAGDYRVIALGEDYDHALVGSEDREFLWVLARERDLPQATFDRLIERARSQGFNTDQVVRTEQSP